MIPLLSIHLKARREARGLSQDQAASLFDVDRDTVSRWERGKSKPAGAETLKKIKLEYSITQRELDDWYSEWAMQEIKEREQYRIRGFGYLEATGIDEIDLARRLIEIDHTLIPNLTEKDEGTAEQWAKIFRASPFTWKVLTYADQIIGYWQYVYLQDAYFDLVKAGKLHDSEIDVSMLDFPSLLNEQKTYKMYIIMIGVHSAHQHLGVGAILLSHLIKQIQRDAENGFFCAQFAAVGHTPDGVKLCRELGMDFIGRHASSDGSQLAEVFHAPARQIVTTGCLSRYPKLVRSYLKRFPFTPERATIDPIETDYSNPNHAHTRRAP